MKTAILKMGFICLFLCLTGAGCEKENEYSTLVEGYVVGSFICHEIGPDGQATGNQTERGYCILLEGSENVNSHWPMDIYTFDLPAGLLEFPEEIASLPVHRSDCGPSFFPDNFRNSYKISFQYKVLKGKEKIEFDCGVCLAIYIPFPWKDFSQVSLSGVSKIN